MDLSKEVSVGFLPAHIFLKVTAEFIMAAVWKVFIASHTSLGLVHFFLGRRSTTLVIRDAA
jgi:hypothetical protein